MAKVKSSTGHLACSDIPVVTAAVHDVESQVMREPKVPMAMTTAAEGDSDDDDSAGKRLGIALFCFILVGFVASFFLPGITILCQLTAIVIASILQCGCCCAGDFNLKPHVKKRAKITLVILCFTIFLQFALIGAEASIEEGKLVPIEGGVGSPTTEVAVPPGVTVTEVAIPPGVPVTNWGSPKPQTWDTVPTSGALSYPPPGIDGSRGLRVCFKCLVEGGTTAAFEIHDATREGKDESSETADGSSVTESSDVTVEDEELRLYLSIVYYGLSVLALIFSGLFTWGRGYGAPLASG